MKINANIKMYKVGELGDCFLVKFTDGQTSSNVLIDCGSFRNGKESIERMRKIAGDINSKTNSRIDFVVATHQHNDHVSGFFHAQDIFKKISIGQVWLSWLDDTASNPLAAELATEYSNLLLRLRKINLKIKALKGYDADKTTAAVDDILGFYGIDKDKEKKVKDDKFPPDLPAEAFRFLKTLGEKRTRYLNPGEIFDLPGLSKGTVRVYVLGPPKDEKALKSVRPKDTETYDHELSLLNFQSERLGKALDQLIARSYLDDDGDPYPFDEADSEANMEDIVDLYMNKEKWRQIENDWLHQAERLALWIDNYTNNSSLVLAFELVQGNKVLLFAADAQTGNWNSWKTVKWKTKDPGINWKTLLRNTVLYKVGHHCSHNATLVEGLEAMEHEQLVAMIPVDKLDGNINRKDGKGWKMPAVNLYARLKEKTKNRILRMDEGIVDTTRWAGLLKPIDKELYIEYEIEGID